MPRAKGQKPSRRVFALRWLGKLWKMYAFNGYVFLTAPDGDVIIRTYAVVEKLVVKDKVATVEMIGYSREIQRPPDHVMARFNGTSN